MTSTNETVLILTPMKSATRFLDSYFARLGMLTYPAELLSLGIIEGDSSDSTFEELTHRLPLECRGFRRKQLVKKDFKFHMPEGVPRYSEAYQAPRRAVLARARNHLLFRTLDDEDWVLWIDVDVEEYPPDIIERLIAFRRDIVHPNCVTEYGGDSFDRNAWRSGGTQLLSDLRGQELVRLDSVGGTMLLIRGDRHRDGLVFPTFFYGRRSRWIRDRHPLTNDATGEIETEGLGIMAKDMGIECWGLPDLEIRHAKS